MVFVIAAATAIAVILITLLVRIMLDVASHGSSTIRYLRQHGFGLSAWWNGNLKQGPERNRASIAVQDGFHAVVRGNKIHFSRKSSWTSDIL